MNISPQMNYEIIHKPSFTTDFIELPKSLQKRVVQAIKNDIQHTPDEERGNTIKKLKHYKRLWRYRIDKYRLIYSVDRQFVILLGIGLRDNVYKQFYPDESLPDHLNYPAAVEESLFFFETTPPKWVEETIERQVEARRLQRDDKNPPLPKELTSEVLTSWNVPFEYHAIFNSCKNQDDLLYCKAPQPIVEQVLEYLYPKPADQIVQQPNLCLYDADDLIKYAEGDLLGFLLKLDTDQERYVKWALDGPTLVKGGPGAGKSTVALYRAREYIIRGAGTVLFTTYTNALVRYCEQLLRQLIGELPAQIRVSTLDSIAIQVVQECDGKKPNMGGDSNAIKVALTQAINFFAQESKDGWEYRLLDENKSSIRKDYLVEEIEWVIEGQNIQNLNDYMEVERSGRGYRFNQYARQAMWNIYLFVRDFLSSQRLYSWGYVRARALELVKSGVWNKKWDTVIVDEAQDLTPTALALCIELCQSPSGVFLTADASQSIYNRGFRWKNVHEKLNLRGRTRILNRNYRSTHQIIKAAAEILQNTEAGDTEVLRQTYVHSGIRPALYICDDEEEFIYLLSEEIISSAKELRLPVSSVAILVPNHQLAKDLVNLLGNLGLPAKHMTSRELNLQSGEIKVLTIHSAKGLEFPIVIIPYVEEGVLPRFLETINSDDIEQHLDSERRLLFVGCTRAMRRLSIFCRLDKQSQFIGALSQDAWR